MPDPYPWAIDDWDILWIDLNRWWWQKRARELPVERFCEEVGRALVGHDGPTVIASLGGAWDLSGDIIPSLLVDPSLIDTARLPKSPPYRATVAACHRLMHESLKWEVYESATGDVDVLVTQGPPDLRTNFAVIDEPDGDSFGYQIENTLRLKQGAFGVIDNP